MPSRPTILPRHHPWLLTDIYIELRCIPRLFFDPRYHLSWQTLLLAPLLLLGLVLSKWMIGQIPLIGWVLDFVLFPVLLYVLFKVLSREATRYRQTSPDLPLAELEASVQSRDENRNNAARHNKEAAELGTKAADVKLEWLEQKEDWLKAVRKAAGEILA